MTGDTRRGTQRSFGANHVTTEKQIWGKPPTRLIFSFVKKISIFFEFPYVLPAVNSAWFWPQPGVNWTQYCWKLWKTWQASCVRHIKWCLTYDIKCISYSKPSVHTTCRGIISRAGKPGSDCGTKGAVGLEGKKVMGSKQWWRIC